MLSGISTKYCGGRCPFGGLGQTIGYSAKGCAIDYLVQDLKVPFAFTWEIYTDNNHMGKFTGQAQDDAAAGTKGSTEKGFWDHLAKPSANQVKDSSEQSAPSPSTDPDEACMRRFNPMTEGALRDVLDVWTQAYLDIANQVAAVPASAAQGTASETSSSQTVGTVQEHGLNVKAFSKDATTSDAAQSDGSDILNKPASAAEYVELMREQQQKNERSSHKAEEDAEEAASQRQAEDDANDKLSAAVPSWDALKPGGSSGKWDFLKHLK
jgi:hypothetical protein